MDKYIKGVREELEAIMILSANEIDASRIITQRFTLIRRRKKLAK